MEFSTRRNSRGVLELPSPYCRGRLRDDRGCMEFEWLLFLCRWSVARFEKFLPHVLHLKICARSCIWEGSVKTLLKSKSLRKNPYLSKIVHRGERKWDCQFNCIKLLRWPFSWADVTCLTVSMIERQMNPRSPECNYVPVVSRQIRSLYHRCRVTCPITWRNLGNYYTES